MQRMHAVELVNSERRFPAARRGLRFARGWAGVCSGMVFTTLNPPTRRCSASTSTAPDTWGPWVWRLCASCSFQVSLTRPWFMSSWHVIDMINLSFLIIFIINVIIILWFPSQNKRVKLIPECSDRYRGLCFVIYGSDVLRETWARCWPPVWYFALLRIWRCLITWFFSRSNNNLQTLTRVSSPHDVTLNRVCYFGLFNALFVLMEFSAWLGISSLCW